MTKNVRVKKRAQEFFDRLPGLKSVSIEEHVLLDNIKHNLPLLKEKLKKYSGHGELENMFYRGHCGSNKVYKVQDSTIDIVETLRSLSPILGQPLGKIFQEIYEIGTGKIWQSSHNENWNQFAIPTLTAFLHAKTFLEFTVEYGDKLKYAPACLPYGWAAVLSFYSIR